MDIRSLVRSLFTIAFLLILSRSIALGSDFDIPEMDAQLDSAALIASQNPDSAAALSEAVLLKASELENDSLIAKSHFEMAKAYYFMGYYDLAANHFKTALSRDYSQQNIVFRGRTLNNLGVIYDILENFEAALEAYLASLDIDISKGDSVGVAYSQINIGLLYINMNQPETAKSYLLKAKKYFERNQEPNGLGLVYHNLGNLALKQGDLAGQREAIHKAARHYKQAGNIYEYTNTRIHLANAAMGNYQYEAAQNYLDSAIVLAESNGYEYLLDRARLIKAELLIRSLGKISEAEALLEKVQSFNQSSIEVKKTLDLVIRSQTEKLADFEQSVYRYKAFLDSTKADDSRRIVNELHIKYETDKKIAAIAEQAEKLKQARWKLSAAFGAIFLLTIGIITIFSLYRQLHHSHRKLYQKNQELISQNILRQKAVQTSLENEPDTDSDMDEDLWQRCLKILRDEKLFLESELNISRLAAVCGSNRTYVSKVINAHSGQNFNLFINQFRTEHAAKLLITSESSLDIIALDSGFNSVRSFFRIFRQTTGLTPGQYRRIAEEMAGEIPEIPNAQFMEEVSA